jgi:hypothetical protein
MRGWPVATIAFYGPNPTRATKVAVGIIPSEGAEPTEMRDCRWKPATCATTLTSPARSLT